MCMPLPVGGDTILAMEVIPCSQVIMLNQRDYSHLQNLQLGLHANEMVVFLVTTGSRGQPYQS